MGNNLRGQEKEVSKCSLDSNSDGALTLHSDSYPGMRLTHKSVAALAALLGKCEGIVPFIIDITAGFEGATACDFEINVKVARQDVQYPGESMALSVTAVTFPNIANTGDCMRDNLRGQENVVLKLSLSINSDGTLTFHSDGYPGIKLTQKSIAALAAPSGKYESSVPFIMTSPLTSRVQLPATSKST